MTFLDKLIREQVNPNNAYHQFLLNNWSSPGCVHTFFEGINDPSFYTGFLRRFVPYPLCLYTYICGNKAAVYETYVDILKFTKPQGPTLFFVDKDFSDILKENYIIATNIYVTDYYSIENYLICGEALARVCSDILHLPNTVANMNEIQETFRIALERFYEFVLPFSAWIVYVRRSGFNLKLDNIDFSDLLDVSEELALEIKTNITREEGILLLEQWCEVTTPTGYLTDIDLVIDELSSLEPKLYVRGKFELWFFIRYLEKLIMLSRHLHSATGRRTKIRTQIHEKNAMEILGSKLQIPVSLEKFLQENLNP